MFDKNQNKIFCDHVDDTGFHIVEMGCQMVQLLSANIVGPTVFVNLTPASLVLLTTDSELQHVLFSCYSLPKTIEIFSKLQ